MAELNIGGETFHAEFEGEEDAPVLMLSNAIGTNLHMWDEQVPALLKHYRVLRYDARGHGASVVSEGPYSIADLGHDALGILDTLGLETVDFLGLSLGGIVGQWLLTHAPKRIGKAILADTASQIAPPDMWNSRIQTVLQEGMEPVVAGTIEHWFTRDFREANPQRIAAIEDMIRNTPPQGYAATCAALRDVDLREAVRSIQSPVLVMVGRHDAITPPGISALLMSSMQKAKLVTLQAAHLSNVEDAENFTEKALSFLLAAEPIPEPVPAKPKTPTKPRVKKPKAVDAPALEVIDAPVVIAVPVETGVDEKPPLKKSPAKKLPVKKKAPVKATAKKKAPTKAAATKAPAKKAAVKKAPAKKAAAKKASVKKMAVKKAVPKKAAIKKTSARKAIVKKAAPKKSAIKKSAIKKTTVKKMPTKKAAVKKGSAKKPIKKAAPPRKTSAAKATLKPLKKTTAKKTKKR